MNGHKKFLALSHVVLIIITILAVLPFYLLILASFSEEKIAVSSGYSLIPNHLTLAAYQYLMTKAALFGRGYLITIIVTVVGVFVCILITLMFSYMLSRPNLPFRRILNFYVIFTMLFNGGLVSTYILYTQTFHIKDTLWALIIPNLLTNAFFIIMVRNYFTSNIPEELIEAARIDGCSETGIFFRVAFRVSYWNDWQNGLYYLDDQKLYGIQNILNAINANAKYLMSGANAASMPAETARMAAAVIGIIPILIIYPFFQSYFVKGITMGAVKG